jgi:hypothetical protein
MKTIRLSPDYFCYPIWHDDGANTEKFGDIDPRSLPISAELAEDLIKWAQWFDKDLDMNDPENSRGMSPDEKAAFTAEGERLLDCLRHELGPDFRVNRAF